MVIREVMGIVAEMPAKNKFEDLYEQLFGGKMGFLCFAKLVFMRLSINLYSPNSGSGLSTLSLYFVTGC